ncbi:hypothetical protein VaNZ11_012977 [Volvox africanus]|uniref:TFIIS N-terminal domain-containing protein n=1 Tax=Volvox africanus TaxID=51714 RepID=A0ABQ5SF68_9CHLO|nr:hypothetical protein VaNZ11_012977 [Volvox africanus]
MDAEKQCLNLEGPKNGAGGFCLSAVHEVLQQLDSSRKLEALGRSLSMFESQLRSLELIYHVQSALAFEFGLHGALAEGCAIAAGTVGDANGLSMDPNSAASGMSDIFSVNSDCFVDRELVRALAWQANCQQEAVRKELRVYQRAVSDRLSLAAKRAKTRDPEAPPPPPIPAAASGGRSTQATATQGPAVGGAALFQKLSHQQLQHQQSLPQPPGNRQASLGNADVLPTVDERIYCLDEREEAARKAQLDKLSTLINPETGGISISPISVVGVFQQLMVAAADWRVRRVALEAMSRSPLDVLWRLLQNSRVLDCLHNWLQDALADHQLTMLKLLLSTMTCLPMRRDLLKGSKLEAALEGLAYAGSQRGGGGGAAAAAAAVGNDGGPALVVRNRFGDAAAAVLAEWRKDPDHITVLRRAGAHVPETIPAAAAASTAVAARVGGVLFDAKGKGGVAAAAAASAAAGAAAPPVPGSRLLGAAAAKDGMRKRALSSPRPMGDARASPKPRVAEVNGLITAVSGKSAAPILALAASAAATAGTSGRGHSGTAGGGSSGVLRRDSLAAAAPSLPVQQPVDMTAKLGEKGPADPDVVAGFRSRFGDGSVRRSQLARPARIPSASNAAATREASPEPVAAPSGSLAATGREGKSRDTAGRDPSEERPSAAAAAAAVSGHSGGSTTLVDLELGPDALARLRAERQSQRQAAALAALQAEARRHPEVVYSELVFEEKMKAFRQVQAARALEEQQRTPHPDDVRRAHQSMKATVPWSGPPPRIWLPDDQPAGGRGEESEERQQAKVRQQRPKVSYPSKDCIPDSPAEPPPSAQQQQQQQLPPRAIPWFPAVDGEEVALDWFRQNLVLWERGIRRAEHVLPPALLHRHLELHPKHLPPQYAATANLASGAPSRSAAARHNNKQSPQGPPPPPPLAAPAKLGEVSPQHTALAPLPQQQLQPSLLQLQPQIQLIEASAAVAAPWTTAVAADQHALPPLQQLQPQERKAKWSLMPPVPPPAAAPVQLGMMPTMLPLHVQPPPVQQAYESHGRTNGGLSYYDNYGAQGYGHKQTRLEEKGRSLHHDGPVQGEYGGPAGGYGAGEAYGGLHYVKQDQDYQGAWR